MMTSDPSSECTLLGRHRPEDEVAFTPGKVTTASQLRGHVRGLGELLPMATPGQEVVVICRDRYRFTVALLAAWTRGYSVALPPGPQVESIVALRQLPGVFTVIHDVDGLGRGIDVREPKVVQAARSGASEPPDPTFLCYPKDRHLVTVYTSGSTGAHTACPKTAGQLLSEAGLLAETFRPEVGTRFLPMVPPHHIYGLLFGVLLPLTCGGSFYRQTPLHQASLAAIIEDLQQKERQNLALVSVPAHLRGLLLASEGELPDLDHVFSSGAPLSEALSVELEARFGWRITEVFGSSETGGIGWRHTGGQGPWTPFDGVRVEAGQEGAMQLRSPFLHPDTPQPYESADRVEVLPHGRFEHRGRRDGVLKIGGVRVSLAEVEQRLRAQVDVIDVGLVAVEVGGARGHEIWAAVVTRGLDVPTIRRALGRWLSPMALPRRYRLVEALPRTETGKLRRQDVIALFGSKP